VTGNGIADDLAGQQIALAFEQAEDVIKLTGLSRNIYYCYKPQLREEKF